MIVGQLHLDGISDKLIENLVYNYKAVQWLKEFWEADEIQQDPLVIAVRAQKIL